MDDDYNVISTGYGDDGGELQYPDDGAGDGEVFARNGSDENERRRDVLNALEETGLSRKRRFVEVEEVYGKDGRLSHPLDWHMRMPLLGEQFDDGRRLNVAKRRALDELEKKINEAAVERNDERDESIIGDDLTTSDANSVSALCDEELTRRFGRKREIMSTPPIDGSPWIGISDAVIGKRMYIRMIRDSSRMEPFIDSITKQMTTSKLGYRAFEKVMKEADELRHKKLEAAKKAREEQMQKMIHGEEIVGGSSASSEPNSALWVNKYSARNFAELLSDDTVNRNILTWLKLWDECVFKRNIDSLLSSVPEKLRDVFQMDNGKVRRPAFKMVLLAGPAGLGKTTLAKIVARQAGYTTVDVNSSDARTVADLNRVLEGAVKIARTLDADSRPNCLILDEIDGAPIDTIRHLIRCLQAVGKKAIRRPIIGICNNL
ncbi:unnamed protein product [Caenorhabditis bovis]|uniref:AAA+ ATPase domain-containing protein n=1 Tax=Caenorhabditis bovis TaxID=2654633 RepID=A0A8S1ESB0_9PELO|nr:unnamed protein product [Caenorhabditis bovis]